MEAERLDVPVGFLHLSDLLAGKAGWQPPLPELVFAFDFAVGLWGWGLAEADVVELENPAQLGQGIGGVGEENALVVDIELLWPTMLPESCRQEIKVGEQSCCAV